jgi:hypothetical protein
MGDSEQHENADLLGPPVITCHDSEEWCDGVGFAMLENFMSETPAMEGPDSV